MKYPFNLLKAFLVPLLGEDYLYNFKTYLPLQYQTLYRRGIAPDDSTTSSTSTSSNRTIMIITIISAILFIIVVSYYDIVRNWINNYYAKLALEDPLANNTTDDINSTLIANYQSLIASIVFAIFCTISGVIAIYILLKFM